MPRKKQAQPKHCQEHVDNHLPAEQSNVEQEYLPESEDEDILNANSGHCRSSLSPISSDNIATSGENELLAVPEQRIESLIKEAKEMNEQTAVESCKTNILCALNSKQDNIYPSTAPALEIENDNKARSSRASPDLRLPVLLPELVHPIKSEPCEDIDNTDVFESGSKLRNNDKVITGNRHLPRRLQQDNNFSKPMPVSVSCYDDGEHDDSCVSEKKFEPPTLQEQPPLLSDCDDISNGLSSPGSKTYSPNRPYSNGSENSSCNVTTFGFYNVAPLSSSSSSSSSRAAGRSPSYTVDSHVNRLQSFVESLTTPVTAVRSKLVREARSSLQSPPSFPAKHHIPENRDAYRTSDSYLLKSNVGSAYAKNGSGGTQDFKDQLLLATATSSGNYVNSEQNDEPLDLSTKRYGHKSSGEVFESEGQAGAISGSASLLKLQSKFGENSPMLTGSTSKFQGANYFNNVGYSYFKHTMYEHLKTKGQSQGISNGFETESPSIGSSTNHNKSLNEISSLKQMVTSCETNRSVHQGKMPNCYEQNRTPTKRPRNGIVEKAEASGDRSYQTHHSQPQQSVDTKKSKLSLHDRRLEKLQRKKMQNFNSIPLKPDGNGSQNPSSQTSSEASHQTTADKKKVHTNQKCSCGITYSNLFQLTVHVEETGHTPEFLELDTAEDLPKLVRGQDVWISQGPEQTEMILRCIQCRTSFRSLPELTVHMVKTKHYINIVKADGDFSDSNNRNWLPKPSLTNDQQKPSSSLSVNSSTAAPSSISESSATSSKCTSGQILSQDKKTNEQRPVNKPACRTSDSESSSDKSKSEWKNPLKFGITEMLDFPSYKKMLKKMTENCEEIKPVDGVALTLFQERLAKQATKVDSPKNPNNCPQIRGSKSYSDDAAVTLKHDFRGNSKTLSKPTLPKVHQTEVGTATTKPSLSGLTDKYLSPQFAFASSKSHQDSEKERTSNKTNSNKKSLDLVSPLPYGVDGASSLKAMESFIESSFSKISQSLHTPSSLPFPSFASRCLITAPVLENVYNNAFLRDSRMPVRHNNCSGSASGNKIENKKRSSDQSLTSEELLKKRKKLQTSRPSNSVSSSQTGSTSTQMGYPQARNDFVFSDNKTETRFTISSESSSATDDFALDERNQQINIKTEKDVGLESDNADEVTDFRQGKTSKRFQKGLTNDENQSHKHFPGDSKENKPMTPPCLNNSLDSIRMLASKFFSSDNSSAKSPQVNSLPIAEESYFNSYLLSYAAKQNLTSNYATENNNEQSSMKSVHRLGSSGSQTPHCDSRLHQGIGERSPTLITVKPEPRGYAEERANEVASVTDKIGHKIPINEQLFADKSQQQQITSDPRDDRASRSVQLDHNDGLADRVGDDEEDDGYKGETANQEMEHDVDDSDQSQQVSTNALHLTRCQPSTLPIGDTLSTGARSCQQVQ